MAKVKTMIKKPSKMAYKQETYQPVVKGKMGVLTEKKATKLKSDRKKV